MQGSDPGSRHIWLRLQRLRIAIALAALALPACSSSDSQAGNGGSGQCTNSACTCTGTPAVSFSSQVQPIFSSSCAMQGCHSGKVPGGGMDLTAGAAYQNLVGVASTECSGKVRVAAGDPSNSYLVNKLVGYSICSGTKMPKTGKLAQSDLDLISGWICSGAPDN